VKVNHVFVALFHDTLYLRCRARLGSGAVKIWSAPFSGPRW